MAAPEPAAGDPPAWLIVLIPIAFCVVFPLFWCFVMWINSHVGGWSRLAARYRAREVPEGRSWHGTRGMVGPVSYRGVLSVIAGADGLFLVPSWPFRFGHPPLFLPWSDFHEVKRFSLLWLPMVRAKIGDPRVATLSLPPEVFLESEGRVLLEPGRGGAAPGDSSP